MFVTLLVATSVLSTGPLSSHGPMSPGRQLVPVEQLQRPEAAPSSQEAGSVTSIAPRRKNPYAGLFRSPKQHSRSATPPLHAPRTSVVCGMKMFYVDPGMDPRILLPSKGIDVDPAIRRQPSSICRE